MNQPCDGTDGQSTQMDRSPQDPPFFLHLPNRLGNGSDGLDDLFLSLALVKVGTIALGANGWVMRPATR